MQNTAFHDCLLSFTRVLKWPLKKFLPSIPKYRTIKRVAYGMIERVSKNEFLFRNKGNIRHSRHNWFPYCVSIWLRNVDVQNMKERICCVTLCSLLGSSDILNWMFDGHWYFPGIQPLSPAWVNGEFSLWNSSRMPSGVVANSIPWARQPRELGYFDLFTEISVLWTLSV